MFLGVAVVLAFRHDPCKATNRFRGSLHDDRSPVDCGVRRPVERLDVVTASGTLNGSRPLFTHGEENAMWQEAVFLLSLIGLGGVYWILRAVEDGDFPGPDR